jgi:hypothetical protein
MATGPLAALGEPGGAAALEEDCLAELRRLGARLRTLAAAGATDTWARVDDACADALAEVDPAGGRVRLRAPIPVAATVRGAAAAVTTAIASLLEHALAASPAAAPIELAVRALPGGQVVVEIVAPDAGGLGPIDRQPLDTLLATTLRPLRGDVSLVLAGALADAIGGDVHLASSAERGLVLDLRLVAHPAALP